jgi:hypothetical protein
MAATLTCTLDAALQDRLPYNYFGSDRFCETVKIVGASAAAADTGTYTQKWAYRDPIVIGFPGTYAYSAGVFTFTAGVALGSTTTHVIIVDRTKGPL